MIWNLHNNTTARFVVNGMLSDPIPVSDRLPIRATTVSTRGGNTSNRTVAKHIDPRAATPGLLSRNRNYPPSSMTQRFYYTARGNFRRYWLSCVVLRNCPIYLCNQLMFLNRVVSLSELEGVMVLCH